MTAVQPSDAEIIQRAANELADGVWIARAPGGELVFANRAFREIMGIEAREDVARGEYAAPYGIHTRTGELYPESAMPFVRALEARASVVVDDIVIHRPDGGRVFVRAHAKPVFLDDGETISHVVIAFFDISREVELERRRADAEARFARAQRMESIGNLAGGIAHDFNNLLAVLRLLSTSLRRGEEDPQRIDDLRRLDEVVDSAAGLTRSLSSFAGRGAPRKERTSVSAIAQRVLDLFERAVDRRIAVRRVLVESCDVIADPSQLDQVLMNLAVNARDAVADMGSIEVRVYATSLDEATAAGIGRLTPGDYVALEVRDDGAGIDPAIRERVFEPYFTTKTAGPTRGTLARVWLPAAPESAEPVAAPRPSSPPMYEPLTLLLVEDEPLVQRFAARALRALGHTVLTANDGVGAMELFAIEHPSIDVVVLDMIMPRMAGRATFQALRAIDPLVQVVLTTGYARNDESEAILALGVQELLEKPYRVEVLEAVLQRLGRARRRRR